VILQDFIPRIKGRERGIRRGRGGGENVEKDMVQNQRSRAKLEVILQLLTGPEASPTASAGLGIRIAEICILSPDFFLQKKYESEIFLSHM
jgi:hypothetical protein